MTERDGCWLKRGKLRHWPSTDISTSSSPHPSSCHHHPLPNDCGSLVLIPSLNLPKMRPPRSISRLGTRFKAGQGLAITSARKQSRMRLWRAERQRRVHSVITSGLQSESTARFVRTSGKERGEKAKSGADHLVAQLAQDLLRIVTVSPSVQRYHPRAES
jgi:hypothetical protein